MSTSGVERVLYRFNGKPDGATPEAALVALDGKLYGTTRQGGHRNYLGTIFEVDTFGTERLLYRFNFAFGKNVRDGTLPTASLIAVDDELYGTTSYGGTDAFQCDLSTSGKGCGTFFEVSTSGVEHVLYRFKGPPDGMGPNGLVALNGKFYGMTDNGFNPTPQNIPETFFELTKSGNERVLYRFRGVFVSTGPLVAANGKLYGTTFTGGTGACYTEISSGCGTVFEITTSGVEKVLYSFKGKPDGASPNGGLVFENNKLYGTTADGGTTGLGTALRWAPTGRSACFMPSMGRSRQSRDSSP